MCSFRSQCGKATVESLIKAGAFDSLGSVRAQLIQALDQAYKAGQSAAADRRRGQPSLFGMLEEDEDESAKQQEFARQMPPSLQNIPEWPEKEKAAYEKEVLGFYLTAHPLKEHVPLFRAFRTHTTAEAALLGDRVEVVIGGMIGGIKLASTRNPRPGQPSTYANFTLEDDEGTLRSIIWPQQYAQFAVLVKPESVVFAVGRIDKSRSKEEGDGNVNLIVDELLTLEEAQTRFLRGIVVTLDEATHGETGLRNLYEIVRGSPGDVELHLRIRLRNGSVAMLSCDRKVQWSDDLRERLARMLGPGAISVTVKKRAPRQGNERRHARHN